MHSMFLKALAGTVTVAMLCAGASAVEADPFERLKKGNSAYRRTEANAAPLTDAVRSDTAENGQHPYAVVVACSDSRVPVEHIFSAGIGDLFVIRTAGNVLDEAGLGSVEYAVQHLNVGLVVVMGHRGCGAVAAAIEGEAHGHLNWIVDSISGVIGPESDAAECERMNVDHWVNVLKAEHALEAATIVGALYDIESGEVMFL